MQPRPESGLDCLMCAIFARYRCSYSEVPVYSEECGTRCARRGERHAAVGTGRVARGTRVFRVWGVGVRVELTTVHVIPVYTEECGNR